MHRVGMFPFADAHLPSPFNWMQHKRHVDMADELADEDCTVGNSIYVRVNVAASKEVS